MFMIKGTGNSRVPIILPKVRAAQVCLLKAPTSVTPELVILRNCKI